MSQTLLLAVDTTSHTAAAADLAADLASRTGDRVIVLHVHEYAVGRFGRVQVDCFDGDGEKVAADIAERLRATGVDARADVRKTHVGTIAREILATAAEYDARIIILGSTTKHDVPMLPFGSVSLRLLHHSDRPVLIVPKGTHAERIPVATALATTVAAQ